jgi:hypothetical protein
MKQLLAVSVLALTSLQVHAGMDVIYGKDNRQDVYQVKNALFKKLAASTAGMVSLSQFSKSSKPGFFDLQDLTTLERGQNVCPSESFSQQPLGAMCSGFLVGPDTLVTAGHCYKTFSTPEDVCKRFGWVFEYDMKSSSSDPTKSIPLDNVYLCKKIVIAELSESNDFAIIKLDRKVVGRKPLKFRTSGKVSDSAELVVIGHPSGLPTKISDGGKVTRNTNPTNFSTTLDTFQGNSGSAVFDAKTGMIEGILIQGKTDYVPSKPEDKSSCVVVNKCDDLGNSCTGGPEYGGVSWGEVVFRIPNIASHITTSINLK